MTVRPWVPTPCKLQFVRRNPPHALHDILFVIHTAAAYSVVQQRYLLDSGLLRPGVPHDDVVLGVARLLAYSFAYQPLWLLLFAWADDVPWFGFSIAGGGDKSWAANTARALQCSFAGGCEAALPNFSKPVPVPLFAFIYVVGYVMYYGGLGGFWVSDVLCPRMHRHRPAALYYWPHLQPP